MKHLLPKLPYALNALEPCMSEQTLNFHFNKHLQTYLDNVNHLVEDTPYADFRLKDIIVHATGALLNNAAQAYNHILFFKQLAPVPVPMSTTLTQHLVANFGSVEAFKDEFIKAAIGLFGSGWVWLAQDADHVLKIVACPNAGNPITQGMRPLMCIDVWEHAYYLDYQNRRAEYVNNFWYLIDWKRIESRIENDGLLFY